MFTGLVTDLGTIRSITQTADGARVRVQTAYPTKDLQLGESIAVDGACLTVTSIGADDFTIDASLETIKRSTLGHRRQGDRVHLERALAVGDRLGGHFVLGHVDGVGTLRARSRQGNAWLLEVEAPESVYKFLIDKGSIAVDGVSLTVNWVEGDRFGLAIIPFTGSESKLLTYQVGHQVNLEADVLGKYVYRFLVDPQSRRQGLSPQGITQRMLEESGFL